MWARIDNGMVVETIATHPSGRFHPSLVWIECSEEVMPGWQYDGKSFSPIPERATSSEELCALVDAAADAARRAVAGDPLRAVEYDRAASEAQAFADTGYPADEVPRTVAAWAINGRTAQQAADSILTEAAVYTEALYVIREVRLAAKDKIRALMAACEAAQAQHVVDQALASLNAAVVGVGNA